VGKTASEGKESVAKLCAYFSKNVQSYRAPGIKEAHVRQSLIDPLFEALGWDVGNSGMVAPQYREVIPEDSLDVEGMQKAPDYTFRIGTLPKFFVEAKKCGINIGNDPAPAYQLRRYGWSAKISVSLLTDFEEFSVYDCTLRPSLSDKASYARISYFQYLEYPDRWQEIWDIFSREAAWSGAFDQYAISKRKKGTSEVDVEFLKEIEVWRDSLAHNIALRNASITSDDLNASVQLIIDRIIFLRMAEDKGLESEEQLLSLATNSDIYERFVHDLCRHADQKYNSGLFHFVKEEGVSEPPDRLTPTLSIDDKPLKDIIQSLYFAYGSPYHFGVLPVEILGTVYERFLGKVIRLTSAHHAKVEEKPEVRKAGGVFYTPAFIVDYIVKNAVEAQISNLSPKQLAGSIGKDSFRVLDMACGSGSFLLGAYKCLLRHCLKWYLENSPEKHKKALFKDARNGDWRLTIEEKRRILTAHIFGVDIDPQAVEVSKLSLLLSVLEGETDQTIGRQLKLFQDRALPNLSENIRCGNSLIGIDYDVELLIKKEEESASVNPFDWQKEFAFAMSEGGFNAIIGNPPYVLLQDLNRDDNQLAYFRKNYDVAAFKLDTYHLFIERSIQLSKERGRISMITPANFITNNHLDKLRRHLLLKTKIDHILVIDGGVFPKVSVDNAVFLVEKLDRGTKQFQLIHAAVSDPLIQALKTTTIQAKSVLTDKFTLFTGGSGRALSQLWGRLEEDSISLGTIANVNFGKQLRDRSIYTKDVIEVASVSEIPAKYKACYGGKDINRYSLSWGKLACLDSEEARRGGCWDSVAQNSRNKLLTRQIGQYPTFAIDEKGYQCLNALFMINIKTDGIDPMYLLGLLNSSLLRLLWLEKYYDKRRTFPKIKGTYLKELPIHIAKPGNVNEVEMQVKVASYAKTLCMLHKELANTQSSVQRTTLERQIEPTEFKIDKLVFELYGLSPHEIVLVAETGKWC
jgi:type I restriction-modification system DNA methylase subunit